MWAANDNGSNITWIDAVRYCENYRVGGYSDWRLPTLEELEGLYVSDTYENKIKIINCEVWASDTRCSRSDSTFSSGGDRGTEAAAYNFGFEGQYCEYKPIGKLCRVLPVRFAK